MIFKEIHIPQSPGVFDIEIKGSKIIGVTRSDPSVKGVQFDKKVMVFPGLINMHDHLAMNFFTPFRSKRYRNYIEWSADLHEHNTERIQHSKKLSDTEKMLVGELKNLLCGFTSVCDHESEKGETKVLQSFTAYNYLHSTQRDHHWQIKLNTTINKLPWIVHVGEGSGDGVENEVDQLMKWNLLRRKIIAVHGISMTENQSRRVAGLIWCPGSNFYLYGKTADTDLLKKLGKKVFFGSDASLTGDPNIWNHIRLAMDLIGSKKAVYEMLTTNPASYFTSLQRSATIQTGSEADLAFAFMKEGNFLDSFYCINPADIMIVVKGGIVIKASHETTVVKDHLTPVKALGISSLIDKKIGNPWNLIADYPYIDKELNLTMS